MRFLLGDTFYNAPNVEEVCRESERILVTPQRGPYPHQDEGVEVRRIFHRLRSVAIENLNENLKSVFKSIFDVHRPVPMKTQHFVLGAVWVYQMALSTEPSIAWS
ncbi:MAG TPA: hypothetical protein VHG28_18735 [Longimicrobiaceae bacterium]|nr:hypothetical protein [Longimicrobiaceae bacterium]